MKYKEDIIVDRPLEEVVALFDNPSHYPEWMDGLLEFEVLEGDANQPASKSRFKFKMGKREIEMTERITNRDLPKDITREYNSKGVFNIQSTGFEDAGNGQTRVITNNEFRFRGVMMKAMGFLMPGAFKKQSRKILSDFKNFAENHQEF